MNNFITNLLLIKDQNIRIEDKLYLINVDGQENKDMLIERLVKRIKE